MSYRAGMVGTLLFLAAGGVASAEPIVEPGKWNMTIEMLEMSIPGIPPEFLAMMKKQPPMKSSYCLSQEEAEIGPKKMIEEAQDKDCTINHYEMKNGKLDAELTCKVPEGTATVKTTGTYTRTRSDMMTTMTSRTSEGDMNVKSRAVATHAGKC